MLPSSTNSYGNTKTFTSSREWTMTLSSPSSVKVLDVAPLELVGLGYSSSMEPFAS